jgi:hypothetical protein
MRWPRKPSALVVLFVVVSAVTVIADTLPPAVPTAVGTVADAWANVGGADKPASVATNDGDTSYIEEDTGAQGQWFLRPTLTFSSSAVASVSIKAFCREIVAAEVTGRVRVNGTNYTGSAVGVPNGASYSEMTWTWATNPNTTAAWVEADVKGSGSAPLTEFGIQASQVGVGDEVRCTYVYLTVDYTAAAATGAPRMLLLGVGDEWR